MARLILPSGHRALIDDDFCRIILAYHWYFDGRYVKSQLNGRRHLWYRDPNTYLYLHRVVMGLPPIATEDDHVHHRDGNPLNCLKANLLVAGRRLNNQYAVRYRDRGER
jgi:hypothetical protein